MPTTNPTNAHDATRTRLRVVGALIAFAWLLAAVTVIGLLVVLPDHQVDTYAGLIVIGGLVVGAVATFAVWDALLVLDD